MSGYGQVAKVFWTRSARTWTDDEKLLGLYLLSGPHHSLERFYRLPLAYVTDDLGWTLKRVQATLATLEERRFIQYDHRAQVVLVVKSLSYQSPRGPKQIAGALKALDPVPATPLLNTFLAAAERYAPDFAKGIRERYPGRVSAGGGPQPQPNPTTTNERLLLINGAGASESERTEHG